jgi:hypothetical protein
MTLIRTFPFAALLLVTVSCAQDTTTEPLQPRQFATIVPSSGVLTLVENITPAIANTVYALADASGGRLSDPVNGHEIKIMPKTVAEPTYFVMQTQPGLNVVVDLTAWRRINGAWVQVTTFDTDGVKLRLSYARTNVKQANRLKVVYVPNDDLLGALDPLETLIDRTNKQAQAKLSHFSRYAMAID